jgi:hypothetical protein
MADLLAVVSHEAGRPAPVERLEALVAARVTMRGEPSIRRDIGAGPVRVAVVGDHAEARLGAVGDEAEWVAWAGPITPEPDPQSPLGDSRGQFALVRHRAGETTIATDPLGMKPAFVAERDGLTFFSTSALALASHLGASPSVPGINRFLRCGLMFGTETLWQGIERLTPGTAISFGQGGPHREIYWQPPYDESMAGLPIAETAAAWIERNRLTYEPFRERSPWADLTGGFDSRASTLLARRFGVAFTANTSGEDGEEDVVISKRIADLAGWPWQRFALPDDYGELIGDLVDAAVGWGDGHLDVLALAEVLLGHQEKSGHSLLLLNGGGGEHLRDYPWAHELLAAGRTRKFNLERLIAWRLLGPADVSLFRSDPTAAVSDQLRATVGERLAPFATTPNTFQGDIAFALRATGHFGAHQAAAGGWLEMSLPFYERDPFVAAIATPPAQRRLHGLMRQIIFDLDPQIASLPTETGGPAEPMRIDNLPSFAAYPWRRGVKFAARLRGRLSPLSTHSEVGGGAELRRTARSALLAKLIAEGRVDPDALRCSPIVDPQRVRDLFAAGTESPADADWATIGRLLTVELALAAAAQSL